MSSHPFHVPQTKAEADPRRWLALAVLLIASFMNLIDVTIVNVAIPSMQQNLRADASQIEWVIAAYVLAFALGLLPFGRLGDIVGRTRMFLIGVAAFTAASAACGLAPSIEWLIAFRVIQGLAGAVMTPQVLAIATVTFPPEERGRSFSLFALSAGLAAVAGPLLGGLLIGGNLWGLDWRPIFLVNVPVGLLALVAGWFIVPRPPGHPDLKNDVVGIVLFAAGMVALVYPLIEGRSYGWPAWSLGADGRVGGAARRLRALGAPHVHRQSSAAAPLQFDQQPHVCDRRDGDRAVLVGHPRLLPGDLAPLAGGLRLHANPVRPDQHAILGRRGADFR